jgi:hypothetical protein
MAAICPFHEEKSASFYVYSDGHFYCYGCGDHGDVIDLHQKLKGLSRLAAAEDLNGGAAPVIVARPEKVVKPPYELTYEDGLRIKIACERLAKDQKLIERFCQKRPEWKPEAIRSVAVDGILGYEDNCVFNGFSGPAVLFAYEHGIKARWINKEIRWIVGSPNGGCWRQSSMFPVHTRAFITEGESDTLTGVSLDLEDDGRSIVLGLSGANIMPLPEPFKGMEIVVIPDLDKPGEECCKKLQELLQPVAKSVTVFNLEALNAQ